MTVSLAASGPAHQKRRLGNQGMHFIRYLLPAGTRVQYPASRQITICHLPYFCEI